MLKPHLVYEKKNWQVGKIVCGLDEVGRGCVAGPVVAAAVVFAEGHNPHKDIRDSKTLSAKKREELFEYILVEAFDYGIGLVPASVVDSIGINDSCKKAMHLAVKMLKIKPDCLLIDAISLQSKIPQISLIKGDTICYSISAASIVAKVFRDRIVAGLDNRYPEYGFSSHKGYGTAKHFEAIKKYGYTNEHRQTFLKK